MVLADGPTTFVAQGMDAGAAIMDYVTAVEDFVRDCAPELRKVLCRSR